MATSLNQTSVILNLPDELWLQILRCARAGTPLPQFVDVLLVCKRLHAIGNLAALEMIHITRNNFDNWIHSTKYVGVQYLYVKHLTITLNSNETPRLCDCEIDEHYYDCGQNCAARSVRDGMQCVDHTAPRLEELARVLKMDLRNLLTFALTMNFEPRKGQWCACTTSHVPSESIAKVLENLPSSCESLLLDTRGCETSSEHQQILKPYNCRLCNAIISRMKSLKHIWLRTASLCRWFMIPDHTSLPRHFDLVPPHASWFDLGWPLTDEYRSAKEADWTLSYYEYGRDRSLAWKAWNNADAEIRSTYMTAAKTDRACMEKPRDCSSFPYLISLTINLAVFPAPYARVSDDAAKRAQAIVIARDEWGCFPALRDCSVLAQHLENLDDQESSNLFDEIKDEDLNPGFEPLSEVFVWDIFEKTTDVLPFRFLTPECGLRVEHVRKQKVYAFHDLITKNQYYGSFDDFNRIIDNQISGGWITSATDGMMLPKSIASQTLGLERRDAFSDCLSREVMEREILGSELVSPLWVDRAYAAQARRLNGILDSLEVRDTTTGELSTQQQYKMRELPEDPIEGNHSGHES